MRGLIKIATLVLWGALACCGCSRSAYAPQPPPPAPRESAPSELAEGEIWIAGHWKWTGRRYAWVRGRSAQRQEGHWVPGKWIKRARGWVYLPGHWD